KVSADLSKWARQGVLLWNYRLVTLKGHAGGLLTLPWYTLTKEVLETVYLVNPKTVFVFVGTDFVCSGILPKEAIKFSLRPPTPQTDTIKGTHIFSTINKTLSENRLGKINWAV